MRSPKIVQMGPHIAVSRTGSEEAQRTPDHEQLQWEQIPGEGKTARTGSHLGAREGAPSQCPGRDLHNLCVSAAAAAVAWPRVCRCGLAGIPVGTAAAAADGSRMGREREREGKWAEGPEEVAAAAAAVVVD